MTQVERKKIFEGNEAWENVEWGFVRIGKDWRTKDFYRYDANAGLIRVSKTEALELLKETGLKAG